MASFCDQDYLQGLVDYFVKARSKCKNDNIFIGQEKCLELVENLKKEQMCRKYMDELLKDGDTRIQELSAQLTGEKLKCKKLKDEVDRNGDLSNQFNEKVKQLEESESRADDFLVKVLTANEKISELENHLQQMEEACSKTAKANQMLEQKLKLEQLSFTMRNQRNATIEAENSTLVALVNSLKMHIKQLEHRNNELQRRLDHLKESNAQFLDDEKLKWMSEFKALTKEKEELSVRNKELGRDLYHSVKQVENFKAENAKLLEEKLSSGFTEWTAKVDELVSRNDQIIQQAREESAKMVDLKAQNEELKSECSVLKQQIQQFEEIRKQQKNTISDLNISYQKLESENRRLNTVTEEMQKQKKELNDVNTYFKECVVRVEDENVELKKENENIELKNVKLEAELQQLKARISETQNSYQELIENQSDLEAHISKLSLELENKEILLTSTKSKFHAEKAKSDEAFLSECNKLKAEMKKQMSKLIEELEEERAELRKLQADSKQLLSAFEQTKQENEEITNANATLLDQLSKMNGASIASNPELIEEVKLLNTKLELEQECLDAAHKRIDELISENNELQIQLRRQSLYDDCLIMDSEYKALKDSVESMILELKAKDKQIKAFKVAIGPIDKMYAKLQSAAVQMRKKKKYRQSIVLFKRALALEEANNKNEKNTLAWLNYWIAQVFYFWKNYEQTFKYCSNALQHLPDICAPKWLRAKAGYKLKKYELARADLKQVLVKTPRHREAAELLKACKLKIHFRC